MTPNLSTGQPSTLGAYHDLCSALFGKESGPAVYFAKQIADHDKGRDEPVLAAESQMMFLVQSML